MFQSRISLHTQMHVHSTIKHETETRQKRIDESSPGTSLQLPCPSQTWLGCLFESPLFFLNSSFISVSFLSTKSMRFLKLVVGKMRLLGRAGSAASTFCCTTSLLYLLNCKQTLQKKTTKAMKQAMPHMRKRPQKLFSERRLSSMGFVWTEHVSFDSHLSWILCSSPFSESCRIAVERSIASGESRWNACRSIRIR